MIETLLSLGAHTVCFNPTETDPLKLKGYAMDAARNWSPTNWALPDMMRHNKVADAEGGMPADDSLEYPFRDDGNLVFNAIKTYMHEAVAAVYKSDDAAVAGDEELKEYAKELSTVGHPFKCVHEVGKVRGARRPDARSQVYGSPDPCAAPCLIAGDALHDDFQPG